MFSILKAYTIIHKNHIYLCIGDCRFLILLISQGEKEKTIFQQLVLD